MCLKKNDMTELNYNEKIEEYLKWPFGEFPNKIKLRCVTGTSKSKIEEFIKEYKHEYPVVNAFEMASNFFMTPEDVARWLSVTVSRRLEDKAIIFYPEAYMHPTEIKNIVKECVQKLIDNKRMTDIDLIFVTNSPIVLSDFPTDNVTFLDDFDRTSLARNHHVGTFAANLYDLYVNALMDKNKGVMGKVCASIINKLAADSREGKAKYRDVIAIANIVDDEFLSRTISRLEYVKE